MRYPPGKKKKKERRGYPPLRHGEGFVFSADLGIFCNLPESKRNNLTIKNLTDFVACPADQEIDQFNVSQVDITL